jgi:saccharopine dehydrogenase-like NADP-dependent oxidoreductase
MKKVLILGAGMVVRPMVIYLLDKGYKVTIASRTKSKAERMINDHPNGKSIGWLVDDEKALDEFVFDHDLVVSLLPYAFHVMVAKMCIKHKKDMVTTSYVKPEMKALDAEARKAGIIVLNELGVDPGIDHMSAMRIIDYIHGKGGDVKEFYSFTGALVAPEVEKNPFNYKFTWAPKGVVMAGKNDGQYLLHKKKKYVPTEELFRDPLKLDFPDVGAMEVYPNRDSLPYIDLYGIPETETIFRGTFRYPGWCEIMDAFKKLDLLSYDEFDMTGMTYSDFIGKMVGMNNGSNIEDMVAGKLGLSKNALPISAMIWLGLLSEEPMNRGLTSPFEVISDIMIDKMMIKEEERDMVVMQHTFLAVYGDGSKEIITSRMLDFGTLKTDTSIARTVSLPAACAVDMILQGKIDMAGVHIPVLPEIYNPVLDQLEEMGIKMIEEYGLKDVELIG